MTAAIRSLLPIIAEGTAALESAFLSAGQGLSQGLRSFESLNGSLAALGAELDEGGTASASRDLGRMSGALRAIAERLPGEGGVLRKLLDGNQSMRRKFDDLVGDMRMMVIVSRSARLEAVHSHEQRLSLEEFSRTIDQQIGDVQRRIDVSAAGHGTLTALLERNVSAHLAFEASFREKLVVLAGELDQMFRLIARRREAGLAFADQAGAKARGVTRAAGMALVSLQVGDNTRQRLEHVTFALERAEAAAAERGPAPAATAEVLCRIAELQLRDTVSTFEEESSCILDSFETLRRDTGMLVSAGRTTYGGAKGDGSFMSEFKARFAAAREIVGACEVNRRAVEEAIGALRAMLDALDQTLTTLARASDDLVIVAVNVGLKAMRLGSQGRGLVTVSGELKRLAAQIALHADGLLSTFQAVRDDADHFGRSADEGSAGSAPREAEAAAIFDALAQGDTRFSQALAAIDRAGLDFEATMDEATRGFERLLADTGRLTAVADDIAGAVAPAGHDEDVLELARRAVDDLLIPLYSMSQERDVHARAVGRPADDASSTCEGRAA